MTIDPRLFVPALLLLLFPGDRLLSSWVELRAFGTFRNLENSPLHRPWWWVSALWLDPVRAFVGTLVLRAALVRGASIWATTEKGTYITMVSVLLVAVLAQLFTRREQGVLLAPLGFVAGIVAALAPWAVALIGLAMALTGMFAFRQFHAFFSVGLAAVGLIGFAMGVRPMWLVPALAVLALPFVVSAVTGRSLEIAVRRPLPAHP